MLLDNRKPRIKDKHAKNNGRCDGQQETSDLCIVKTPYAEASTTDEPDAGKPHVRVCAGGAR